MKPVKITEQQRSVIDKQMRSRDRTRRSILAAAENAFAATAYRDVTLKSIADRAGVSAPLIIKYFGSKEFLFDSVIDFRQSAVLLFEGPRESLGVRLVTLLIQGNNLNAVLLANVIFPSEFGEVGNRKLRENYSTQIIDTLSERLAGTGTRLRAELVMSMVIGLAMMHRRGLCEFETNSVDLIVSKYSPLVQELIDG